MRSRGWSAVSSGAGAISGRAGSSMVTPDGSVVGATMAGAADSLTSCEEGGGSSANDAAASGSTLVDAVGASAATAEGTGSRLGMASTGDAARAASPVTSAAPGADCDPPSSAGPVPPPPGTDAATAVSGGAGAAAGSKGGPKPAASLATAEAPSPLMFSGGDVSSRPGTGIAASATIATPGPAVRLERGTEGSGAGLGSAATVGGEAAASSDVAGGRGNTSAGAATGATTHSSGPAVLAASGAARASASLCGAAAASGSSGTDAGGIGASVASAGGRRGSGRGGGAPSPGSAASSALASIAPGPGRRGCSCRAGRRGAAGVARSPSASPSGGGPRYARVTVPPMTTRATAAQKTARARTPGVAGRSAGGGLRRGPTQCNSWSCGAMSEEDGAATAVSSRPVSCSADPAPSTRCTVSTQAAPPVRARPGCAAKARSRRRPKAGNSRGGPRTWTTGG